MRRIILIMACAISANVMTSCIDDVDSSYSDALLEQKELQAQYDLDYKEGNLMNYYANAYADAVANYQTAKDRLIKSQRSVAEFKANPKDNSALQKEVENNKKEISIYQKKIEALKQYRGYEGSYEELKYQAKELGVEVSLLYEKYQQKYAEYNDGKCSYEEEEAAYKAYTDKEAELSAINSKINNASSIDTDINNYEKQIKSYEEKNYKLEAEIEYPTYEGTLEALEAIVAGNEVKLEAAEKLVEKKKAEYEEYKKRIGA